MSQAPNESSQTSDETGIESNVQRPVSPESNEDISRRRALKLGVAGILAAGAGAIVTGARPPGAQAADGDPLKLGQSNSATSDTKLIIDNSDPNTTTQVDGLLVKLDRGFSAIYGIAGSGAYGAVRAKNTGGGPGLEAEGEDGPGIVAKAYTDSSGVYAESDSGPGVRGKSASGPGVQGEGNATGPGVLAWNNSGGNALEVDGPADFTGPVDLDGAVTFAGSVEANGPAKFNGAVEFDGSTTKFTKSVEFQGGVQLGLLAGSATIQRGRTSVTVPNAAITNQSVIVLTPVGNPSASLPVLFSSTFWHQRKPGTGFVVHVSLPPKQDLEFAYFIAKL